MTSGTGARSGYLLEVSCACGGSLREVDAYDGSSLTHHAACNRCGARFSAERALRAADDARWSGEPVQLTPYAG